jgi:hypothetical protein
VAFAHQDGHIASVDNAVFAFEVQDGSERPWCLPVGLAEITVDGDDILGVQLPDGTVAQEDFIFDSADAFLRNCKAVFAARAKRKAAAKAEHDARQAVKDLL